MSVAVLTSHALAEFAGDVREGLLSPGQKTLPSKYLYDAIGSALFEAICLLPEYGLTRAESNILECHAGEIVSCIPPNLTVVELGSGSGYKTRIILDAIRRRHQQNSPFTPTTAYHPIEISLQALQRCESEVRMVPGVRCLGIQREYLDGLREVVSRRSPGSHLLVLFLGSSIGNFTYQQSITFLEQIRELLQRGDSLLLAADLVKPVHKLLAAYDDPTGVTASFNLNLLARINRELQANFDLANFEHRAIYNHHGNSMEMHLRSRTDQSVHIDYLKLDVSFIQGETIWTETSHKYTLPELHNLALASHFRPTAQWLDPTWEFAENLWTIA